jgi:hypothetical protein
MAREQPFDQRDSDFDGLGDACDATPVHDLAVGILNAPRVVVRPREGGHTGPGTDRDPVNNFASTSGLLRVR